MGNDWLRLWHDMPNDPKWRTIARVSKRTISDVIAVYVHMMVCASANATERGRTQGWCDEDVANALELDTESVVGIREAMEGRVIENDYLKGWNKRQPKREDGASERAKAWRNRNKSENERNRTQPNATERIRTLDKDKDLVDDKHARVNEIFAWLEAFLNSPTPLFSSPVVSWLDWGADFELDIKPVAERWRKSNPSKQIRSLEWLNDAIASSIKKRSLPVPIVVVRNPAGQAKYAEYSDTPKKNMERI